MILDTQTREPLADLWWLMLLPEISAPSALGVLGVVGGIILTYQAFEMRKQLS